MNEHQQACCDMLEFHGINYKDIPADGGVTQYGYSVMLWDEKSFPVIDSQGFVVLSDEIPWPKSFPVASFFEHYWAWKGAVR